MKGCVQWNPFTVEKISPRARLEPRTNQIGSNLPVMQKYILIVIARNCIEI